MAYLDATKLLGVVGALFILASNVAGQTDLTRQPGTKGASVVNAVVDVIRHSCIFPDDKFFLRRLAFVESQDGISGRTYRPRYDGGIWQIELDQFNATQHTPSVEKYFQPISDEFGVDWLTVTWSDLRKPLYSGLAASLYLQTLGTVVPRGIENQGVFWTNTYDSASVELSYNFTVASSQLKEHCQGNQTIDLTFILDGSSSISPEDFQRAKDFVLHVIDIFTVGPDDARIGVITYSSDAVVELYLGANQTKEDVKAQVGAIKWRSGTSATGKALELAANRVFRPEYGGRDKVPKAVVLLSDGQSDDFYQTESAAKHLRGMGITVFAVGVGAELDLFELRAVVSHPECTHLFLVESYSQIDALVQEIQHASCRTPTVIGVGETVVCELHSDSKCIFQTQNISSLQIDVDCGSGIIYSSYNNPYPGSAYYELTTVANPGTPVVLGIYEEGRPLYIAVQGSLLNTGITEHCFATLGPQQQKETFELICRENGKDRECRIPEDLVQYKPQLCDDNNWWDFTNPCTQSAVESGQLIFPHPYKANMYLTCDQAGGMYIVICPKGTQFNRDTLKCGLADPSGNNNNNNNTRNETIAINPCSPDQLFQGHYFFPYLGDHHKFIHCDVWGHPWVMDCSGGFVWDQRELTCVEEFLVGVTPHPHYNPCTHENIALGKMFFPYPDDNRHYIRCDAWGQAFVMPCDPGTVWNQEVSVCVWGRRRRYADQSSSPCTRENLEAGKLFFPGPDPHQYIHCDLTGQAFVQTCDSDMVFDPPTGTCV